MQHGRINLLVFFPLSLVIWLALMPGILTLSQQNITYYTLWLWLAGLSLLSLLLAWSLCYFTSVFNFGARPTPSSMSTLSSTHSSLLATVSIASLAYLSFRFCHSPSASPASLFHCTAAALSRPCRFILFPPFQFVTGDSCMYSRYGLSS